MLLSIVTINKNNCSGLLKTINSVLSQKHINYEYIIVDGNSTDGSLQVLSKFKSKLSYISEEDSGIYCAFNKGIKKCKGDYIHLLNSGDTYVDDDVFLNFQPKQIFCCFPIIKKNSDKNWVWYPYFNGEFMKVAHPGLIVKKTFYEKYLYNEKFNIISDDYFINLHVKKYNSSIHDKLLVRMAPVGLSGLTLEHLKEKLHLYFRNDYKPSRNKYILSIFAIFSYFISIFKKKVIL